MFLEPHLREVCPLASQLEDGQGTRQEGTGGSGTGLASVTSRSRAEGGAGVGEGLRKG